MIKEIFYKWGQKDDAPSSMKIKETPNELDIPAVIYLTDFAFTTNSGIVNIHPFEGHTNLCLLMSLILIHMAAHLQ